MPKSSPETKDSADAKKVDGQADQKPGEEDEELNFDEME